MLFGLLHCVDNKKPLAKAHGLYDILQDGGMAVHANISAADKDMKPNFKKLCQFVTTHVIEFSSVAKNLYDQTELDKLEDAFEVVLEEDWLEDVYGLNGNLVNATWIEKVTSPKGRWIFDAAELRKKIFAKAGVPTKHIK